MNLTTISETQDPHTANPQEQRNSTGPSHGVNVWLVGGFCLLLAFIFLLIASKSSPLYPFNDWTDSNTFFTLGKGMFNGKVPYRDLFEQKGPLLYFIFGLGYLFSNTTFMGVFILEVLSLSTFLLFSFRLVTLYVDHKYGLIILPLLSAVILNLRSFGHGGSAEQFSLPLIVISMYYLIRYFKQVYPDPMPIRWLFLNGAVAGCILWIKYAFLGFWLGWVLATLLSLALGKKILLAFKSAGYFLGGMLAATLPWIAYFGVHKAIFEWLHAYFIINLTSYPMTLTARERIMVPIDSLQRHLSLNPLAISLLILGIIIFITHKKFLHDAFSRIGLVFGVLGLVIGVYGGGRDYIYYFFIFSPLIVFGFIVLLGLYAEEYGPIKSRFAFGLLLLISLAGTFTYTLRFQRNTYMLAWDRDSQVQYRYAAIINQTEQATLLNYGFQDGGFYTAAGITPNVRFFQQYNIEYANFPLPTDEQNRYIKDQVVDFVVLRTQPADDTDNLPVSHLYDNYQLIAAETQFFGEIEFNYLLFEKRDR